MFLFVAMIHLPGAIARRQPAPVDDRRAASFGGAAWLLRRTRRTTGGSEEPLIIVGRPSSRGALFVFGLEHFLHRPSFRSFRSSRDAGLSGRPWIGYLTGAALLVTGARRVGQERGGGGATRAWIVLLVLVLYEPIVLALRAPGEAAQVVAIDYFVDTLLFAGVVLALARVVPVER